MSHGEHIEAYEIHEKMLKVSTFLKKMLPTSSVDNVIHAGAAVFRGTPLSPLCELLTRPCGLDKWRVASIVRCNIKPSGAQCHKEAVAAAAAGPSKAGRRAKEIIFA